MMLFKPSKSFNVFVCFLVIHCLIPVPVDGRSTENDTFHDDEMAGTLSKVGRHKNKKDAVELKKLELEDMKTALDDEKREEESNIDTAHLTEEAMPSKLSHTKMIKQKHKRKKTKKALAAVNRRLKKTKLKKDDKLVEKLMSATRPDENINSESTEPPDDSVKQQETPIFSSNKNGVERTTLTKNLGYKPQHVIVDVKENDDKYKHDKNWETNLIIEGKGAQGANNQSTQSTKSMKNMEDGKKQDSANAKLDQSVLDMADEIQEAAARVKKKHYHRTSRVHNPGGFGTAGKRPVVYGPDVYKIPKWSQEVEEFDTPVVIQSNIYDQSKFPSKVQVFDSFDTPIAIKPNFYTPPKLRQYPQTVVASVEDAPVLFQPNTYRRLTVGPDVQQVVSTADETPLVLEPVVDDAISFKQTEDCDEEPPPVSKITSGVEEAGYFPFMMWAEQLNAAGIEDLIASVENKYTSYLESNGLRQRRAIVETTDVGSTLPLMRWAEIASSEGNSNLLGTVEDKLNDWQSAGSKNGRRKRSVGQSSLTTRTTSATNAKRNRRKIVNTRPPSRRQSFKQVLKKVQKEATKLATKKAEKAANAASVNAEQTMDLTQKAANNAVKSVASAIAAASNSATQNLVDAQHEAAAKALPMAAAAFQNPANVVLGRHTTQAGPGQDLMKQTLQIQNGLNLMMRAVLKEKENVGSLLSQYQNKINVLLRGMTTDRLEAVGALKRKKRKYGWTEREAQKARHIHNMLVTEHSRLRRLLVELDRIFYKSHTLHVRPAMKKTVVKEIMRSTYNTPLERSLQSLNRPIFRA